ncbi:MAG: RDD family protein [Firmicutes bacterium]|nr:RDD family protein [Bacillota bacterium]
MKVSFKKRLFAYLIDFVLLTTIVTIINCVLPTTTKQVEINKELDSLQQNLLDGKIDNKQYFDGYKKLLPELDKSNMAINVCNLVFILGYFIIIPVVNNGQTLGKKILKIKIEKIDGNLTIRDMVIRNFITTSLLQLMISSTLVYIVNNDIYYNLSIFVSLLQILLVIITSFMIIYRKDEKGVQDLITGTQVIEV